jgi:hypothetical protein
MKKNIFYTGAEADEFDDRDYEYDHIALGGGTLFDWQKGYDIEKKIGMDIPTKDQQKSSSCVGQAVSYYVWVKNVLEFIDVYGSLLDNIKKILREWLISSKAIYSQIFLPTNGGAYLRDGVRLIKDWGAVSEKAVPSSNDNVTEAFMRDRSWYSKELSKNAKTLQAKEYRMIRAKTNIDLVAQTIVENDGAIIGVSGENNGTWRSKFPQVGSTEWGHALYAGKAKLINGKKYIGVKNSWGDDVGESGWQWLGEEWFTKGMVFNPWVIIDKRNSGWVWLVDRNGKPRKFLASFLKTITYLIYKRGFKLWKF